MSEPLTWDNVNGEEDAEAIAQAKLITDAEADAYRRKVSKEGQRLFLASEFTPLPPVLRGSEFRQKDFPKQDWLFNDLVERGQRAILCGQWKSGKTTTFGDALKTICDGGSFLGVFKREEDEQSHCPVLYLNLEVPERTMFNYIYETHKIKDDNDRLMIQNLLGYNVNILNDAYFEELQRTVNDNGVCVLFVDPLRQFYVGDENDNSVAKEVTDRLDSLMTESDSLQNIFLSAHIGHAQQGEEGTFARPRGASKWSDWADVLMSLTRQGEDRFFAVRGRNGELSERRLRLTKTGLRIDTDVTRRIARLEGTEEDVLAYLLRSGGHSNMSSLKNGVDGRDAIVISAVNSLEAKGLVFKGQDPNDRRSTLISLTEEGLEYVQELLS